MNVLCATRIFPIMLKGCVHYIFASLFCMSTGEHLWRKEKKAFLLHFESSFRSWDNQIFTFHVFKCHYFIKCLSMKHILLYRLRSKYSLVMKFCYFMQYYKRKFFIEKFYEKCCLETSSRHFLFFMESSVKRNWRRSESWFVQIWIVLLIHIYYK